MLKAIISSWAVEVGLYGDCMRCSGVFLRFCEIRSFDAAVRRPLLLVPYGEIKAIHFQTLNPKP